MTVETLARLQFAFTIAFHYIYPPLSIGIGLFLVMLEGIYLKTGDKDYEKLTKFWVKIFALTFAIGVATGIVMEFEFGTNWSTYSRFVGDVFGSALASEGIFAFFLESGFLAILVFGWDRVSPKVHFLSTVMVSAGSIFSAVWIVIANSWMQTPAGYKIVKHGAMARAEITDFWAMIFNPTSVERLFHTLGGAFMCGSYLIVSVTAFYLLTNKHVNLAKKSLKIALIYAFSASMFQLVSGHTAALAVSQFQPAKLAAMEAHYETGPASLYLFGWTNSKEKTTIGIAIPKLLSFMVSGNFNTPIKGMNDIKEDERPPVNFVFQTYHIMIAIGGALIGLSLLALFMMWKGILFSNKPMLFLLTLSVLGPQIANQAGWFTAEVGRQPWIVYGLLKTSEGLSKAVTANHIIFSMILFSFVYALLFALFIFLLNEKIKHGPEDEAHKDDNPTYQSQKQLFHQVEEN
ncbi:MAG: cytochrome ubiquinol oxidase subunit I [Candidatus Sericytochromatia bacterium]|nr:cytochrome ubiquinol oxidase subunit I [Candidatus Sericytochromatia bacterium]